MDASILKGLLFVSDARGLKLGKFTSLVCFITNFRLVLGLG